MSIQSRLMPLRIWATAIAMMACSVDHIFAQSKEVDPQGDAMRLAYEANFKDEPIENVLFQLLFGGDRFSIIGDADMRISGDIRAAKEDDAIKQLEDITNVLVVRRGDHYIIYSAGAEEQVKDQVINYVYRARQARAGDLVNIIEKQATAGFPKSNQVIKSGRGTPLTPHLMENSSFQQPDTGNRGLNKPLGDFVEYQIVPNLNGLLLRGPLHEVRQAVEFLRVIDRPIPIVLIEVLIVQYNHRNGFSWKYNFFDGSILKGDPAQYATGFNQPATGAATNKYGPTGWGIDAANLGFSASNGSMTGGLAAIGSLTNQFKSNLTLLMREDLARIVTNPHISVINGQSGTILLDEKFNFTNSVVTQTSTSQKADSLDAVTSLIVTPTVISPELIHLAVNAELGVFTVDANANLPGQRTNEVGTSIVLGENETVIIGGLVKEQMTDNRSKIPGAAAVPLVGNLFRGKETDRIYTETVIYITPHLSEPQGYEERYRKQIFDHTQRLQQLGEEIRANHRMDDSTSNSLYRHNECLDREAFKQSFKEHVRGCQCQQCLDAQASSSQPVSGKETPDTPPNPAASSQSSLMNRNRGTTASNGVRAQISDQASDGVTDRSRMSDYPVSRASYLESPATPMNNRNERREPSNPYGTNYNQSPNPNSVAPVPIVDEKKPKPNALQRAWNRMRGGG